MSYRKFGENDIFVNTMITHPACDLIVRDSKIFYNNIPDQSGSRNSQVRNAPPGFANLYEYNIDRPLVDTGRYIGTSSLPDNGRIYSYIAKSSARASFKTVSTSSFDSDFVYGATMTSSYPLIASITRRYIATPYTSPGIFDPQYVALKNKLELYTLRSKYYKISSSIGNKNNLATNLISIPSIMYGSRIQPGTISLKWYLSGTLIGELKDENHNGQLIQTGPYGSPGSGNTAGVALYDEGFMYLTGAWAINDTLIPMTSGSVAGSKPSWLFYGAGAQDGVTQASTIASPLTESNFVSAAFGMTFKGHTETQVMTMFAHARRGEVNYSNNPTYLEYGQNKNYFTSSTTYEQTSSLKIKNFTSSSYSDYSASFERQVYVSKIALYDKNKNLIGVATLSNPILKKEAEDISFKMRLDV